MTLLKTQSFMIQLMFYNSGRSMIKKVGGQIMNVISSKKSESGAVPEPVDTTVKAARKVVNA
jgi:hypothetical protein